MTNSGPRSLPVNATATDVIDYLADGITELIVRQNEGREVTRAQFSSAFARTFPIALEKFLASLDQENPDLAARLRVAFVAEQEARMS